MSSHHSEEEHVIIIKRRPTHDSNAHSHSNLGDSANGHQPDPFRRQEPSVEQQQQRLESHERPFESESSHSDEDHEPTDVPVRHTCNPDSANHYKPVKYEDKGSSANDSVEVEHVDPVVQAEKAATPKQVVTTARPGDKAKGGQKYGIRKKETPAPPSSTAAKSVVKKRPVGKKVPKVNLTNIERMEPIVGGVNTPRSLAACERLHINPAELCPFPPEHFKGPRTNAKMAEIRFNSYDKRRRAHMEELLPVYEGIAPAPAQQQQQQQQQASAPVADSAYAQPDEVSQHSEQDALNHEDAENQRQFEAYNKRMSNTSGQAHRRNTNTSPRLNSRVLSPRSGAAPSVGAGSIASMSPSAIKIQSHYRSQGRAPTQAELIMMSEIEERDLHRWEVMERAQGIKENQQILTVEDSLDKERKSAIIARNQAFKKETRQEQMFKQQVTRQQQAEQRRQEAERERQEKLQKALAEKDERIQQHDPYANLLARRGSGAQWTGRRNSRSTSSVNAYAERNVADDAAAGLGASPEEAHQYDEY